MTFAAEYARAVPTLAVLRRRLPLVAFVLLAVVLLMFVGIACACLGGHPAQAADRVAGPLVALPPLTAMWALLVLAFAVVPLLFDRRIHATGRASPALLQRFLF